MDQLCPGLSSDDLDLLVEAYKASFKSRAEAGHTGQETLFPGALDALERLSFQDDLLLGIATGKSRRGLDRVLSEHRLGSYFQTTQAADDHPSKPHPSMLHQCQRETGVEAHASVMVGDTSFDMEMGHAAGFATIGVDWGYHPTESELDRAVRDLLADAA